MKKFTSVYDVPDINVFIEQAIQYKNNPTIDSHLGLNKRMGLLFLNPSLRTRISTQIAAQNLGLSTIVLNLDNEGWSIELEDDIVMNGSAVEHIKDAAAVLGQYFDVIGVRSFPKLLNREEDYGEKMLHQIIKYSKVPIVSLESATLHPLQSFADLISIHENTLRNKRPKVVMCWAPHIKALPQCVPNSFAQWALQWGAVDFHIAQPKGFELNEAFTKGAQIGYDLNKAIDSADFVYVKNWSSYKNYGQLSDNYKDWMLDEKHFEKLPNAKLMHCLPVRRNVELSDALLDSRHSIVQQQAANRVWAAQTVIANILKSL